MHAIAVLTGTYLSEVKLSPDQLRTVWMNARKRSRSTHVLFACAVHFADCRSMLRYANLNDWVWAIAYTLRHPRRMYDVMRLFKTRIKEEQFLYFHTGRRQAEGAATPRSERNAQLVR